MPAFAKASSSAKATEDRLAGTFVSAPETKVVPGAGVEPATKGL